MKFLSWQRLHLILSLNSGKDLTDQPVFLGVIQVTLSKLIILYLPNLFRLFELTKFL